MEYFDLYTKNGQKLGKKVPRGSKTSDNEFQKIVNVWIRNKDGHYLIQQRNKLSDPTPFMWATTAGLVSSGDDSFETAIKETKEELGINLNKNNLKLVKKYTITDDLGSFLMYIYLVEQDVLLEDIVIDDLEVKDYKYTSLKEIKQMIISKQFWDYERIVQSNDYFDLIEKS